MIPFAKGIIFLLEDNWLLLSTKLIRFVKKLMNIVQEIRHFNRFYTQFLGLVNPKYLESGLSLSESRIVYELGQHLELPASELVTSLKIDKGYLSRMLKKFEQKGWVHRSASAQDKRVQLLRLSDKGQQLLQRLVEQSEQQIQTQTNHLTSPQQDALIHHLHRTESLLNATQLQLKDIKIRTELQSGDLPFVIASHANLYRKEYNYGLNFEYYVMKGVAEFYEQYDTEKDRVWVCEHHNKRVGFLCLMHRGEAAQLRFFFLDEAYRGIGLGSFLMKKFMDFLKAKNYASCYLWTTDEQVMAAKLYRRHGFRWAEDMPSETTFGRPVLEQKYVWVRN
ncbi:MAG: bifunctional helix-turn-helix transcriptional regulator/GNAT family N-acetyltransferase [Bacteroidota bacterium]